jgi:hypothetical protein
MPPLLGLRYNPANIPDPPHETMKGTIVSPQVARRSSFFNPKSAIGFGRISQRLRAVAHWTLPRRTLWCVERKEQCANAEGFAKGVPNAIALFGFNHFSDVLWRQTGAPSHRRQLRVRMRSGEGFRLRENKFQIQPENRDWFRADFAKASGRRLEISPAAPLKYEGSAGGGAGDGHFRGFTAAAPLKPREESGWGGQPTGFPQFH